LALVGACVALAVAGAGSASATWFNWYNGVVGPGGYRWEGMQHNTWGTENYQTGPFPCIGVTGGGGYWYCGMANQNSITIRGYALGEPYAANGDSVSHYEHLYWCNGSC
jgi:hypothetical protein